MKRRKPLTCAELQRFRDALLEAIKSPSLPIVTTNGVRLGVARLGAGGIEFFFDGPVTQGVFEHCFARPTYRMEGGDASGFQKAVVTGFIFVP